MDLGIPNRQSIDVQLPPEVEAIVKKVAQLMNPHLPELRTSTTINFWNYETGLGWLHAQELELAIEFLTDAYKVKGYTLKYFPASGQSVSGMIQIS